MKSLWFLIPASGRLEITRVCLAQLSATCRTLRDEGLYATAVVVADDENLDAAADLGFGTIERDNQPLGRKWNDAYELAIQEGVDYVVPFGSDDWIDPNLLLTGDLPEGRQIRCSRRIAFVREDGRRMARLELPYDGAAGIRVIPTDLIRLVGGRPASEDRNRAIDTNVLTHIRKVVEVELVYADLHPTQLVDWKSDVQLNSYQSCLKYLAEPETDVPWADLATIYPAGLVDAMRAVYAAEAVAA